VTIVKDGTNWWLYDDGHAEQVDESILSCYYGDQTQPDYHTHPNPRALIQPTKPEIPIVTAVEPPTEPPNEKTNSHTEVWMSPDTSPTKTKHGVMDWVKRNSPSFADRPISTPHITTPPPIVNKTPPNYNHEVACSAYILFYQQIEPSARDAAVR